MKKKIAKYLALGLSLCMFIPSSVQAAVNQVDEDKTLTSEAVMDVASTWTVSVPDSVYVNKTTKTASYTVSIYGNVTPVDIVEVSPKKTVQFSNDWFTNKVTANVSQEKTIFIGDEISKVSDSPTTTTGTIVLDAEVSPAGYWTSNIEFSVSIAPAPGLYNASGDLIATWTDAALNVETDYTSYDDNNRSGKKLETSYPTVTKVVIPYGITKIGDYAFGNYQGLIEVVIPPTVTEIGERAFGGCGHLHYVKMYDGLQTIKTQAFVYAGRSFQDTNYVIPDSVTTIAQDAFTDVYHITYHGTATYTENWHPFGAVALN